MPTKTQSACPCTATCPRHGDCAACFAHHADADHGTACHCHPTLDQDTGLPVLKNENCPCPKSCPRHGDCYQCHLHHQSARHTPYCERGAKA